MMENVETTFSCVAWAGGHTHRASVAAAAIDVGFLKFNMRSLSITVAEIIISYVIT